MCAFLDLSGGSVSGACRTLKLMLGSLCPTVCLCHDDWTDLSFEIDLPTASTERNDRGNSKSVVLSTVAGV